MKQRFHFKMAFGCLQTPKFNLGLRTKFISDRISNESIHFKETDIWWLVQ